jgi:hypothetical protein
MNLASDQDTATPFHEPLKIHILLLVVSKTIGTVPALAVGVPVGAPAQAGIYRNPSVADIANADPGPMTILPVEVAAKL